MKKLVTVANRRPSTLDHRQLASVVGGVGTYEKADKTSGGPADSSYTTNVTTTVTTSVTYP